MLNYFLLVLTVSRAAATYGEVIDNVTEDNIMDYNFYQWKIGLSEMKSQDIASLPSSQVLQESDSNDWIGSCPQWSFSDSNGKCHCPHSCNGIFNCDMLQNNKDTLLILDCNCVTYNEEQALFEFGLCGYNCARSVNVASSAYHPMPANISKWNNYLCGDFKRSGSLCGKCDKNKNLYTRAYSFDMTCIKCTSNKLEWFKYFMAAYFPLTVFCFIILLFRINISSSQLQGHILYSQFMTISALSRVFYNISQKSAMFSQVIKLLGTLYGVWNLDFFRMYYPGFCLQTGMLATLSLDFAVAMYPLFLTAVTYALVRLYDNNYKPFIVLWKPFGLIFGMFQNNWDIRTSIIDSFSTFFFLSNMKFLSVCFDILVPVQVYQFTDARIVNHNWRLYYDATIPYFKESHFYYSILALLAFFLFVLMPVVILLLFPFKLCQRGLNFLPSQWKIILSTFVDSFQGCYKNGTEPGTRDCRWFPAVILIGRFVLLLTYAYAPNEVAFPLAAITFVILAILVISIDPFKPYLVRFSSILAVYMIFAATFLVCGALLGTLTYKNAPFAFSSVYSVGVLVIVLPVLYVTGLILSWMNKNSKFGIQCINKLMCTKARKFECT